MIYQINEKNKTIIFFESYPFNEIYELLSKLEKVYFDIKKWKIENQIIETKIDSPPPAPIIEEIIHEEVKSKYSVLGLDGSLIKKEG